MGESTFKDMRCEHRTFSEFVLSIVGRTVCVCVRITTSVEGLRTARPQTYSAREDRKRERGGEKDRGGKGESITHL